jgi:hypothetical protein
VRRELRGKMRGVRRELRGKMHEEKRTERKDARGEEN